ncbi:hypothetical protein SD78_2878 [Bacillus badius]|nr:hypothetical protein SD78_2878 [Bacillus badius]
MFNQLNKQLENGRGVDVENLSKAPIYRGFWIRKFPWEEGFRL